MSSGGVFSETLQSITTTKLTELSKKRTVFEDQKATLLAAAAVKSDQKEKLRILVDGVKQCFSLKTSSRKRGDRHGGAGRIISISNKDPHLEVLLRNLERFLTQAQYDPSVSSKLLRDWENSLKQQLNVQSLKYQYATLYGELVTEWLSSEQGSTSVNEDSEMTEDFEHVRKDTQVRDEGRAQWESMVFKPFETNLATIVEYLRGFFETDGANKDGIKALYELRKSVESFQFNLSSPGQFNQEVLGWTINGLLASGLLSEEKRAALKDFLISPVILTEVADVLNMRMASIDTWSWDMEGLPVEQRRHVTSKYHIYIEEDLLQAIFLQYIGVKWSVFFKKAATDFLNQAWKSVCQSIPKDESLRRRWFLGAEKKSPSVQSKRQRLHKSIYFMSQLPDSEYDDKSALEGEEEADYDTRPMKRTKQTARASFQPYAQGPPQQPPRPRKQIASKAFRRSAPISDPDEECDSEDDDSEDEDKRPKSPMETKQLLLHLLSSEILLNTHLNGEFTAVHSEFDAWSPLLPHTTIHSVLAFFGLSPKWLRFFTQFLEAPLKFVEDGDFAKTRIRKRGVPGAHALSAFCGEAVLFCLDYAVNQQTDGAQLYRMHDDIWIWSPSHEEVVKGWQAVTAFAKIMGVSVNEGKTGTVRIMGNNEGEGAIDPSLPEGDIRWGFLHLDPITGKFLIDQSMLDKHIEELKRQLQGKKSIFAWIQTWNTFASRFFTSNFGKPANCFGREHVGSMFESLKRIQRSIFSDTSVVEYLKNTMKERFGIENIPDGYLYFPASLGGLELHNPFIGLVQLRDSVYEQPESALDEFIDAEKEEYHEAKQKFEMGQVYHHPSMENLGDEFMSFNEFKQYREEFASHYEGNLHSVFEELLKQPTAETVDVIQQLKGNQSLTGDYWQWVSHLYGPDMIERFGGLQIVDTGLLPIGMVNLFREGKVKWQG